METSIRKVIKIGEKSYGITIPKEWLDKLKIRVGSTVETVMVGDHITIRPVTPEGLERMIILEEGDESMLSKLVIASYIEGKDLIALRGDRGSIRRAFNSVKDKLPGMIFVERGELPEIRITADERMVNIIEIIKTMRGAVQSMIDQMVKYLDNRDPGHLKEILMIDDELDSLYFIGLRSIKRMSAKMPEEAIDLTIVVKALEHMGDALDRSSNYLMNTKISEKCANAYKEMLNLAANYFSESFEAFLSGNYRVSLDNLNQRPVKASNVFDISKKSACFEELSALIHETLILVASSAEISEASVSRYIRNIQQPKAYIR
ncbi:MAG TPA: phosphate uptake regulator PhoU [Sulfolobales archaeon]|nr:phosphate uptake regulator PhoU [Sulfolobales archaeon]